MRNGLLALAVVGSLCSVGQVAAAQPAPSPSPTPSPLPAQPTPDQARADARKRLNEGLERYGRGDYDGARLAFEQAYAVLASIDLLYNLSLAEVRSGHSLEALVHLRQILRNPVATAEDRAKARRLIDEANQATAHIAIEAPAGAEILIDHVSYGEAPVDLVDLPPGKHVCEARANGAARVVEVVASIGGVVTARFALDAARAPTVSNLVPMAPPPPAAPTVAPPPPPVETARGPDAGRSREAGGRIIPPLVLAGAGVVALGVGVALGVEAKAKEDDAGDFRTAHAGGICANRSSATCQSYADILGSQQSATNAERWFLIFGGAAVVAGGIWTYAVWPRAHRTEGATLWVAPAPGGASLGGAF